jgi:hypothetical protein
MSHPRSWLWVSIAEAETTLVCSFTLGSEALRICSIRVYRLQNRAHPGTIEDGNAKLGLGYPSAENPQGRL